MSAAVKSVRFRIFAGFLVALAPLVFFLYYNNQYSIQTVRTQLAQNYFDLLSQYVVGTDETLKEFNYYLYRLAAEPDVLMMQLSGSLTDDYVLAKQRMYNKFINDLGYYKIINTLFLYYRPGDDFLIATQDSAFYRQREETIRRLMSDDVYDIRFDQSWNVVPTGEYSHMLAQVARIGTGMYAGVLIDVAELAAPLRTWDIGPGGGVTIVSSENAPLTSRYFDPVRYASLEEEAEDRRSRPYRVARDEQTGERFLVVDKASSMAPVQYKLIVAESVVLKNLPYLQHAIYLLPLVCAVVPIFYLIFLQRVFFRPMALLIRAMRKIGQGKLDVRLEEQNSSEFNFFVATFNQMAEQIENLKINVYEEKLRAQQAQFKQLQAQINPHFYMNCLNIIYNLAALKEHKSVQKMALHLAQYFRYIMRSHRDLIPLQEEIEHIRNYLEIQHMRYPDDLDYEIRVPEPYLSYLVPPLIVQPFVENAVIHGFRQELSPFRIVITAEREEAEPGKKPALTIRIEDNGAGFPQDVLRELNSDRYLQSAREDHLGVWNVLNRLRVRYGTDAEVRFANRDGERGALVRIRLPDTTADPVERHSERDEPDVLRSQTEGPKVYEPKG